MLHGVTASSRHLPAVLGERLARSSGVFYIDSASRHPIGQVNAQQRATPSQSHRAVLERRPAMRRRAASWCARPTFAAAALLSPAEVRKRAACSTDAGGG